MIEIIRYSPDLKGIWDNFVSKAKNHHFIFYRDYMEYHSDRFQDHSLLLFKKGKLVGLLPANKDKDTLISHGGLTFGGILSNEKMTTPLMLKIFNELLNYLKKNNFSEFIYKAIPYIYYSIPAEEDRYALFINNAELYRRDITSAIYLKNKINYLYGRKYNIKKIKKENLEVSRSLEFDKYMEIVKDLLYKKYKASPVHTSEEIKKLAAKFPENIKLFTAKNEIDEILGGVIIYENPKIAHCQYIAATEEGKKKGAIDIIIDYLINEYYKDKDYFDFGTSNGKDGKYLNEGLIKYKESFGAKGVVHDFYRLKLK